MIKLSEVDGLTAKDIVHVSLSSLPASATVSELRDYFASSTSRRLATLVDGERFAGALDAAAIPPDADPDASAASYASVQPAVAPDATAQTARDLALVAPSQRVPVVDAAGHLVGVVAIDRNREYFCGTGD